MKNATDWKDALSALSGLPAGDPEPANTEPTEKESGKKARRGNLHIVTEKKGRAGKTATIIEGFDSDDEEIDAIARELRKRLGTGGSARGGEILIQGDRKSDVAAILKEMGFKTN